MSLTVNTASSSVDLRNSELAKNGRVKSDIAPLGLAESVEALSPGNSYSFDGTYNSTVTNTPSLDGTMVISGTSISYSCALGDCSAHDVHMSSNTISFKLTCEGVTYTFAGVYVSKSSGRNYFRGIVHWNDDANTSATAGKSINKDSGSRNAVRPAVVDEDNWQAGAG